MAWEERMPPGFSRSASCRDHLVVTPHEHVRSKLPGWRNSEGIVLISPRLGAAFSQYIAEMGPESESAPPFDGVERFLFVLDGEVELDWEAGRTTLSPGGYAFFPPGAPHSVSSRRGARLNLFEKEYLTLPAPSPQSWPEPVVSSEQEVAGAPFEGDPWAVLQTLLPDDPRYDMAVNIFTFQPGAALPRPEIHVMEHGLIFLSGGGVYRLGSRWYTVHAGDVIWMAPYCPQWFAAVGKQPARYLYYKDVNRDPLQVADRSKTALQWGAGKP